MLYKYEKTGAMVRVTTCYDEGNFSFCTVETQDGELLNVYKKDLIKNEAAEQKIKLVKAQDAAKGDVPRKFPPDHRLNINGATPRMIADHVKGIGLKTAKDIKDLQNAQSGEKFTKLEQLREIPRVDWDSVFSADLIRI